MFVRPVHQAYRTALLQIPYSPTCRAPLPRFRRARAPRTAPFRRYSGYSGVTLYALRFTLYALNMHMWTLHLTCTVQYSTLAGPCHLSTSGHHKLLYNTTLAHIPDGRVSMTLVCVRCSSPPPLYMLHGICLAAAAVRIALSEALWASEALRANEAFATGALDSVEASW